MSDTTKTTDHTSEIIGIAGDIVDGGIENTWTYIFLLLAVTIIMIFIINRGSKILTLYLQKREVLADENGNSIGVEKIQELTKRFAELGDKYNRIDDSFREIQSSIEQLRKSDNTINESLESRIEDLSNKIQRVVEKVESSEKKVANIFGYFEGLRDSKKI